MLPSRARLVAGPFAIAEELAVDGVAVSRVPLAGRGERGP